MHGRVVNGVAPSDEIVEAFAKQLFRSENPPDLLWDTALHKRAGLPTEGYRFASAELRADYARRAREALGGSTG